MWTGEVRDEAAGDPLASSGRANRRGFLGLVGKAGFAIVGGMAAVAATAKTAYASVSSQANWECCNLAYGQPNCPNNSCPSGTYAYAWTCCSGSAPFQRTFVCGECTPNSQGNCDEGPFTCSYGYTSNPNGCTPLGVKASVWRDGIPA